jgi:hypothetical protein
MGSTAKLGLGSSTGAADAVIFGSPDEGVDSGAEAALEVIFAVAAGAAGRMPGEASPAPAAAACAFGFCGVGFAFAANVFDDLHCSRSLTSSCPDW